MSSAGGGGHQQQQLAAAADSAAHTSALATLAEEATGNQALKTIGLVACQVGAIAQFHWLKQ
jgi:hypothetical protein